MNKIRIKVTPLENGWDCGKFNLRNYLDFVTFNPIWIPCSTLMSDWQEVEIEDDRNWSALVAGATVRDFFGNESIKHQELVFEQGTVSSSKGCSSCGGSPKKIQQLKTFMVSWIPIINN